MATRRPGALLAAGVVAAIGGCAPVGNVATGQAEVAAMAATYRYLFAYNVSGLKDRAATYCLGVRAGAALVDPPAGVLAALTDVGHDLEPVSNCRIDNHVLDDAGRPALLFSLTPAVCERTADCRFEGGYYESNISASHRTYRARRMDGRWQVTPVGPEAVS